MRAEITKTLNKDVTGNYSQGMPADLTRFHWYHGKITKEEAEWVLGLISGRNAFLVRQSVAGLILSMIINRWISHVIIKYSPKGYSLKGKAEVFTTIPKMIEYYQIYPVKENSTEVLGTACDRQTSGMYTAVRAEVSQPSEMKTTLHIVESLYSNFMK